MNLTDPHVKEFEENRRLLTGVAYRMLGSVSDAEDMVQETWLRWNGTETTKVDSPRSWLLTIVSRLCLDRLKSARAQREEYFGTWLPEPYLTESSPTEEVDESVSIALLLVLEKLSPAERAGFLLHDVFGHSFDEVAAILDKPAVNCRKLVSRARTRVRSEKPRFTTTGHEHEELLQRFLKACRAGEMDPLMELLADNATFHSDGGGKASAVPTVLDDPEKIARFFIGLARTPAARFLKQDVRFTHFNGAPGLLLSLEGQIVTALSLEIQRGKISAIFAHRNPDKLSRF